MFAKALIGLGVSLVVLSGSAAGQDVLGDPADSAIYPTDEWAPRVMEPGIAATVQSFIDDSWSMAKSITQALVGRAVMEGLIEDIDLPMGRLYGHIDFPVHEIWESDDPRSEITWRQWMMMTDGLKYREVGEMDLAKNDVVQMMFGPGRFDVVDYADQLEQEYPAGTHWNYSTAGYHTISKVLGHLAVGLGGGGDLVHHDKRFDFDITDPRYGKMALKLWFLEALFTPLGMDAQPEFDASGTFLGGSLVYASARDFARFGYLYLRDGVWNGERLLPEGWVDFARRPHEGTGSNVYGAGWWIPPPEGEEPTHPQSAKSAPYDAFHAGGNEGQTIWVVPSKDLVIVRLGLMSNAPENWAALFEWNQKVARAFPDK